MPANILNIAYTVTYRFVTDIPAEELKKIFDLIETLCFEPGFNVALAEQVAVVRNQGGYNQLDFLKWRLIPDWSKDQDFGSHLIIPFRNRGRETRFPQRHQVSALHPRSDRESVKTIKFYSV